MNNRYWKGAAAECIGPLHLRQNLLMQDSHRIKFLKDGFIAVVSDGLGSKKHSDFGSDITCKLFIKSAKKFCNQKNKSIKKMLRCFYFSWLKVAGHTNYGIKECSATLLGVICLKKKMYLVRLGDGMIMCLDKTSEEASEKKSNAQNVLMSDIKEESFSNITNALGPGVKFSDFEIRTIDSTAIKTVFLCTDGISDDLQKGSAEQFVKDLSNQYNQNTSKEIAIDMKHWITNWPVPRHSDDKTAVFVTRV